MPHNVTDHVVGGEPTGPLVGPRPSARNTIGTPFVPIADPIPTDIGEQVEYTPNPEGSPVPPISESHSGLPAFPLASPHVSPVPWPTHFCLINLRAGCYRITFTPIFSFVVYHGTMRVEQGTSQTTISGDLYEFQHPFFLAPKEPALPVGTSSAVAAATAVMSKLHIPNFHLPYNIPIYARDRYHSYLRVVGVQQSPPFTSGPCQLTLTAQEYVYTQPAAGSFNGSFPPAPGARTLTIVLQPKPAPAGYTGSYFEGTVYSGLFAIGSFSMGWVSESFRRATLEIDTLTGAVAPAAVPALSGSGTEDIRTVFASAGWDLQVVYDQTNVPVPAGVNATACWTNADLHALMTNVRNKATNLDSEWHMHLLVVPAKLGCGRGVMYDTINVPREGVASFSDDGYPTSESANFGTAANQLQRNVSRAFMRSAAHEVGHGFNQIHQEQEAGADNSIMTTTPDVANVLGGPTTGAPGVFPDNIALAFNDHVRHHLVHFPDVTVRPGGMTFGSGHTSTVPEADRQYFTAAELELKLSPATTRVALGEPLPLTWQLINHTDVPLPIPSDIGVEAQHSFITVTDPHHQPKLIPSFVVMTDQVTIKPLAPGDSLQAETRLYWSSRGFAFETPGRHLVEVKIIWTAGGVPFGVKETTEIWVDYPQSGLDNDAAATLMHPQVGMYVALGGGAYHLTEAVDRLNRLASNSGDAMPTALRGYEGILPTRRRSGRRDRS